MLSRSYTTSKLIWWEAVSKTVQLEKKKTISFSEDPDSLNPTEPV